MHFIAIGFYVKLLYNTQYGDFMHTLDTFHIFFVLVLLAIVILVRISMNKANKSGNKHDNGLDFTRNDNLDPSKSWSGTNLFND